MKAQRLLMCCLVLVACGEDEDEPRTREQFCQDWAAAACNDEVVSVCQAAGPDECRQSQEDACRDLVSENFSDSKGKACIDAVEAAYKDANLRDEELATVLRLAAPCDQLIKGSKDTGESCMKRSDCDAPAGFDCVKKADKETGTCQIPEITMPGRKCDADQKTCEPGFYCDGENCVESGDVGDDCTIPEQCGETSFCNDQGECEERVDTGEACSSDVECLTGICYEFDGDQECTDRVVISRSEPICDDLR